MSNDTIPSKGPKDLINSSVFNIFRTVLGGSIFPRNTKGVVADQVGSFGDSTTAWLAAYLMTAKLMNGSNTITFTPPSLSADVDFTLPGEYPDLTLPLQSSAAGIISALGATRGQFDTINYQLSSSCGNYTSGGAAFVTNLDVTINSSNPVLVTLISDGSANPSHLSGAGSFQLVRDAATILIRVGANSIRRSPNSLFYIDNSTTGSRQYRVKALSASLDAQYCKLLALEFT